MVIPVITIVFVTREVLKDLTFKVINISKGVNMQSPNSERFAHGIVGACKTSWAYIPFGVSSCVCAGQYFAMIEPKVVLSLILFKFRFSLSPAFRLVVVL